MKKMFMTILEAEKNGVTVDFERFTCKKPETVLKQFKKAFSRWLDSSLLDEYRSADIIRIIATPDGYNDGDILAEYTPEEFFRAIA